MKKSAKLISLLLALVMLLSIIPMAVAADGTNAENDVTLTTMTPEIFTFLRNNVGGNLTKKVGQSGVYRSLPHETYIHKDCNTVIAEFFPECYAASTATVELSDPTVLKDLSYTISGWKSNDERNGVPCLTFNFTAAKPGTTTVKLTYYFNYNHAAGTASCKVCGESVRYDYNENYLWYQETTTCTITVTGDSGEDEKPDIVLPGVTVKKATPKLNTYDHFAYVQGYPDGTVKPAGNITRAETAAILFRLMDNSSRKTYLSTKSGFRDVTAGSWYNTYVATLNNAGVITDSANGYFRPNDAITRAELAAMLASFTETTRAANYFDDVSANHWAANAIAICAKLGWITGYPDGSFRPDRNVTRAELMAMINRATGRAPKSADAFLPGMKTWSDNTADKWYYLDVQEATNSHSYAVSPTELWTALTAAPDWTRYE